MSAAELVCKGAETVKGDLVWCVRTHSRDTLIQRLLWTPLKPCQIRIFSLCIRGTSGLLSLALLSAGVFLTPLNLLRFLAVSLCDGRFSCSSDGTLLRLATRIESPIACWLQDSYLNGMITATLLLHDVSCGLSQEYGRWSWLLFQQYVNEYPGRSHDSPCLKLADGYLP
jgi:hypothetical protein